MELNTIEYKGFQIIPDKLLGYSLIDRKGNWARSALYIEQLKESVDQILQNERAA